MTHLRKRMLEDLQRRNYSQDTIRSYIRTVEDFSQRFNRPPDRLGPRHIREYQAELFQKRKLSPGTVTTRLAALRFFYIKTLRKAWSIADTPYPKKHHRIPSILSPEEVAELIDAARTPYQRILLMMLYATGVRRTELAKIKVSDVDSRRMVIHIQGGKGRKDRCTPLTKQTTVVLKNWLNELEKADTETVFPNARGRVLSGDGVRYILAKHIGTASRGCPSLLRKNVTPHVLRHTTAMELLQAGVDRAVIALWLGHESVETTQIYLDANLALKEEILAKTKSLNGGKPGRYKPDDELLAFLKGL